MKIPFRYLYAEVKAGKSIARILMNLELKQWVSDANGVILDLACGRMPSYRRILGLKANSRTRLVGVEYKAEYHPTVVANLNAGLPFKSNIADAVIASGFLHILPDATSVLNEVCRTLKPGGILLLTTPFLYNHHPEPTDFWRFTAEGLQLMLQRAGFVDITVVGYGGRWTAVAYLLSPLLRPRWIVPLVTYWICAKLDTLTEMQLGPQQCPLGYVVRAGVPESSVI